MKKRLVVVISVLALAIVCAACSKTLALFSRAYGQYIVFGTTRNGGTGTKVAYSGVLDSKDYERIDWLEGDILRIVCPEASEPDTKYADYTVASGSVTSSGRSSSAGIEIVSGQSGLKWGDPGMHHFTALYPAPGTGVDGTGVKPDTVTCVLPETQVCAGVATLADNSCIARVNPDYIYLAGHSTAVALEDGDDEGEPVNIWFDPAVSSFEFVLLNDYDSKSDMTVKKAGITADSGVLCGTYCVDVTEISDSDSLDTSHIGEIGGDASSSTFMEFDEALVIPYGKSLTFTLFTHPKYNITKLTFWFVDAAGVKRSYALRYKDNSKGVDGWVEFRAFHKSLLRGIMAPETAGWTINTIPIVASWGSDENTEIDIETGRTQTFESVAVVEWEDGEEGDITLKDKKDK